MSSAYSDLEFSAFSNTSLFNFDVPTDILPRTFQPAPEGPASMRDPGPTSTCGSISFETPLLGGLRAGPSCRCGTGVPHRGRPLRGRLEGPRKDVRRNVEVQGPGISASADTGTGSGAAKKRISNLLLFFSCFYYFLKPTQTPPNFRLETVGESSRRLEKVRVSWRKVARRFTKVHGGSRRFPKVHEGSRRFMKVHEKGHEKVPIGKKVP